MKKRQIYCAATPENLYTLADIECGCGWPRRACRARYPRWWDEETLRSFFIPMTGLWFWA